MYHTPPWSPELGDAGTGHTAPAGEGHGETAKLATPLGDVIASVHGAKRDISSKCARA